MPNRTPNLTPQQAREARLAARDARKEQDRIARNAESKLREKELEEKRQRKEEAHLAKEAAKRRKQLAAGKPLTAKQLAADEATKKQSSNGHAAKSAQHAQETALVVLRPKGTLDRDPQEWAKKVGVTDTRQMPVPELLIDQVLGQPEAVSLAHKAAEQKRHLLLIGEPGTGKSMIAKALAEILPGCEQQDVLTYHNTNNPNQPKTLTLDGGTGALLVNKYERRAQKALTLWRIMEWVIALAAVGVGVWLLFFQNESIMTFLFIILIAIVFLFISSSKRPKSDLIVPKLLIRKPAHFGPAPYVDATGSQAGALLGDVRHDPYQAGGLETPPHQRVEIGAIHRAHRGVLFIDEINTLRLGSQQHLLTVLQDRRYAISGQSQSSAGAMVRTEPIPADFILVAAGNLDAVMTPEESLSGDTGMHPALRSRLRGYGYEVYVNSDMDDTHDNRVKMLQFVAQEVRRDGKIPHFTVGAAAEIIREGQRRSGEAGKLTLRLRELGGLVRTAGDLARTHNADLVTREHVLLAKKNSRSLEQQMAETQVRRRLHAVRFRTTGTEIGTANGGASVGTGEVGEPAGLIVPVEAAVVTSHGHTQGGVTFGTGITSGNHASVAAVAAVIKRLAGNELEDHEVHLDARLPHKEADMDAMGLAAAVAAYSALTDREVRQDHLLVGGVAIKGQLSPAPNALQIIEAAAANGFKAAILPSAMRETLLVDDYVAAKVEVIFCDTLEQVFDLVLSKPTPAGGSPAVVAATRRKA